MKATEILEKLQNVFLSTEVEAAEVLSQEVNEELSSNEVLDNVELESQEVVSEEVSEETTELAEEEEIAEEEVIEEEEKVEDEEEIKATEYASKEDLENLKKEFMSVLEGLIKKEEEYNKEVPAELSSDVIEEVEEIAHSPEAGVDSKSKFIIGGNRVMTTKDRVFSKMFNN